MRPQQRGRDSEAEGEAAATIGSVPTGQSSVTGYIATNWWYAPSATWSHGPTRAWNFVNDAWTFLAMGLFSDSSLATSVASFLSSRSTGVGSWRISTLSLNSVRRRARATAFFTW